ncbi:MAG: ABC transporter ATP-binding protein [Myxococcota bacterium]|nr:ABC transporter ATP-binding protein [Myxococcota bacterium]
MTRDVPTLSVRNLSIALDNGTSPRDAIQGMSFDVPRGKTVALVGETGSGKTLTALGIMGILPTPPARVTQGSIRFENRDLLTLSDREMRKLRGNRIAMIFQEPVTSLNPVIPVGKQMDEAIRVHQRLGKKNARHQVLALMEMVGIPDPERRYRAFPHQLSGGIRQRVVIAMALACRPDLLLADEPTSALDTTVQAQIVDLLSRLIRDMGMSVLLITHDLGVVAAMADRVIVMHTGRIMEEGTVRQILKDPLHPCTKTLLVPGQSTPPNIPASRLIATPISHAASQSDQEGCLFASICQRGDERCHKSNIGLVDIGEGRKIRCLALDNRNGPQ